MHYMFPHVLRQRRSFRIPPSLPFVPNGTLGFEAPFGMLLLPLKAFELSLPPCFRHTCTTAAE